jgi:ParB family chromosome partitioning protein
MKVIDIPLTKIKPPADAHRLAMDPLDMHHLVSSIKMFGLLNPITVHPDGDAYEILAGHRRYLAHLEIGRDTIPATVRLGATLLDNQGVRFAENFDRADLSPMEEAIAIAKEHFEHATPIETISSITRRSIPWVNERIRLATIDDELAEHVHTRRLSIAAALSLSHVEDLQHRKHLLTYTLDAGATITVVKQWVQEWEQARARGELSSAPLPPIFVPGQPVSMTMPCAACHQPFDMYALRILRICPGCTAALADPAAPS